MGREEPANQIVFCGGPLCGKIAVDVNKPITIAVGTSYATNEKLEETKYRRVIFGGRPFNIIDTCPPDNQSVATLIFNTVYDKMMGNDPRAGKHFLNIDLARFGHKSGKISYCLITRVYEMTTGGLSQDPSLIMDEHETIDPKRIKNLPQAVARTIKRLFGRLSTKMMQSAVSENSKELLFGNDDFKNKN